MTHGETNSVTTDHNSSNLGDCEDHYMITQIPSIIHLLQNVKVLKKHLSAKPHLHRNIY